MRMSSNTLPTYQRAIRSASHGWPTGARSASGILASSRVGQSPTRPSRCCSRARTGTSSFRLTDVEREASIRSLTGESVTGSRTATRAFSLRRMAARLRSNWRIAFPSFRLASRRSAKTWHRWIRTPSGVPAAIGRQAAQRGNRNRIFSSGPLRRLALRAACVEPPAKAAGLRCTHRYNWPPRRPSRVIAHELPTPR